MRMIGALALLLLNSFSTGRILSKQELDAQAEAFVKKVELEFPADEPNGIGILSNKHQRFFDELTLLEQEWVLRLAIAHEGGEAERTPGIYGLLVPDNAPTQYSYNLIPDSVMELMLNGKISPKFQSELVEWLKTDLGYTTNDFNQFEITSREFCRGEVGDCMPLQTLGGICCPFG